jgi:hypothetical protein
VSSSILQPVIQDPIFQTPSELIAEPLLLQPAEPHRQETGSDTSAFQEAFNSDSGAGRKFCHVADAEIKSAIRDGVRSNPDQAELVNGVRQALGFQCDSESIRHRIIGVLTDELLAKRVCKGSDLRFF